MYQALYRKYRPSNLNEVVGQKIVIKTLKNAINNNKISHAYLFTGPRGTGKTSIAKILAKTINCFDLKDGIPCEKCDSCLQINNKQNTDIIEIDAASNNGVDEIRELRNKVTLVPSFSKYKVYIIDEVHMLTQGAFNALLKTLEEPPKHIIFILATTEPHKIPATILSRCQRFDFKKISREDIKSRLRFICEQENIEVDDNSLLEIARLSDGGMRDSISMLDQVNAYANGKITMNDVHDINGTLTNEQIYEIVTLFINKNINEILNKIESYDESGKNLIKLTEEIIFYLKNILIYKQTKQISENFDNVQKQYDEILKTTTQKEIMKLLKKLNDGLFDMKKTINPKINLELLILNLLIEDDENREQIISEQKTLTNKTNINIQPIKEKIVETKILEEKLKPVKNKEEINQEQVKPVEKKQEPNHEKIKPVKKLDEKQQEKLNELKQIRINNTLARLNKSKIKSSQAELEDLRLLSLDEKYCELISYILDGKIKAASDESLVFVLDDKGTSDLFNTRILEIEQLLKEKIGLKFKVISTYKNDWEKIKNEFNSRSKIYEYKEEPFNIKDIIPEEKNEENDIDLLFEDIVEYNK